MKRVPDCLGVHVSGFMKFVIMLFLAPALSSLVLVTASPAQDSTDLQWMEEEDAVVLLDENTFIIKSRNKAKYRRHRVIRINNKRGEEYGEVTIYESKYQKCVDVSGQVMNAEGERVKKLEEKDIYVTEQSGGYVLYDDDRYRQFELGTNTYPYTVEYSIGWDYKSLFNWPRWMPQQDVPVLKSTYVLEIPQEIDYRTHSIGIDTEPLLIESGKKKTFTWELENIEERVDEGRMPPENRIQRALLFSPEYFTVDNTTGCLTSWEGLAVWLNRLYDGKYGLTTAAMDQVNALLDSAATDQRKIQWIYAFLQKSTRYVAIEFGLGGWQPFSAQSVFDNRYGDCKDLSTLMVSMVREVGIEAYPALLRTRDLGLVRTEFPSNQFNHVITFVPGTDDTVWLDCTVDYFPCGELPGNDEGCDALVIKGDTCEFIRTPESAPEDNRWTSRIEGKVYSSGKLEFSGRLRTTGNQCNWVRSTLISQSKKERDRWMSNLIGTYVPKLNLNRYEVSNVKDSLDQPVEITFEGTVEKFGRVSSTRMFINPNMLQRVGARDAPKEPVDERVFPVYYGYAYLDIDSLVIRLPKGFEMEAAPDSQDMDTSFGSFLTAYETAGGTLTYSRQLQIKKKLIPRSDYADYADFIKAIVKNDRSKFVFVKR